MSLPDHAPAADAIPVSLITGFLGSGKTTVLNRLLRHPGMAATAVVINEFGEIGLDHVLVERATEDVVVLNSGCLCCTVRGDLITTLRDLFLRRTRGEIPEFRRVVIETTGLADPVPILHTLITDPLIAARYRLDGVIATVDAVNGMATLDRQPESVKQAAVADRLLLTKSDLIDAAELVRLEARLQALNPSARPLRVVQGEVEPAALFDAGLYDPATKSVDVRRWLQEEAYRFGPPHPADAHDHAGHGDHGHGDHGHGHHDHGDHGHGDHGHGDHGHGGHDPNRHDDHIRAFCLTFDRPILPGALQLWLELLLAFRGPDLLRVKGIVNLFGYDGPVAIHGVQHVFHPPVVLERWPDADRRSRFVFITRDIERAAIEDTMQLLEAAPPPPTRGLI